MKSRGFTLIELLVVISIISLLSSIVLSSVNTARERARIASGKSFSAQAFHVAGDMVAGMWDFNEGSGSNATDQSGYNLTGLISAGASYSADTPGGSGSSLSFNGTSGYVEIPYSPTLAPTSGIAFGAWFKINTLAGAGKKIISKTQGGGYQLSINENNVCPANTYCALVAVGGVYHAASVSNSVISTDKWHHGMASFDGSRIKLYLDGKEVASTAVSGAITYVNNNSLCIGNEPGLATCSDGEYFPGLIDEVRVYAKSLTAFEMNSIYARSLSRYLARD